MIVGFITTNKTDRHDLTEILVKVALNSITLTLSFDPNWALIGN
jgi:ABC-type uncharacterized transport system permease subunit